MRLLQRFAVLACVLPIALGLTLHLLPHTHDDVGWLKTVDQYFMGTNNDFQEASVTYLLTGVMAALKRNPDRRFVYVEQAYFQRWWRRQNNEMKDLVKSFVKNGQLEFANGGWSMHDEATTHNVDMIDQTTLGHQFILEQFGESANPRIAWQLDCFGHSATQAVISSLSGMEALFFGRLDYQDSDRRMANKLMNLWWNPSQSLPDEKVWVEMALDGNYNPPDGFNYDYLVGGDNPPIQNDPRLEDLNVEDRIAAFMNQVNFYVAHRQGDFKTMNIAWMMGSDFHYSSSERNFLNMDKLIQIVNANTSLGVTVRYSTPSEYFNAKMAEKQVWPSKTDDFFPLIDNPNSVWTGYFSSRPGLKGLVRMSSVLLQTARQIDLFAGGDGSGVELLWEAIGVAQHHDAVTGTERQHVAYDYIRRLSVGREAAFQAIDAGMTKLINSGQSFTSCPLINISICAPISNSNHFTVALWNSEARPVSKLVQIPYYGSKVVKVRDASGKDIDSAQTRGVRTAAWTKDSAPNLISFQASLPAMGYSTFEVYVPSVDNSIKETVSSQSIVSDTIFGNDFVQLTVNNATGLIQSWTDVKTGVVHTFSQNFYYYIPSEDSNFAETNNYFFAVKENTGINKLSTSTPTVEVITTDLFVSLIQRWNDWLVQEVRIEMQATGPYVDFLWSVGPVDLDDGISKEVVTRYETDINSGKTFFTDSNGLELQKRILDYRPSFNWTAIAPIQSNYYPSTSLAGITDDNAGLYVVTDRAQGCSSQESGDLEFLVHRRMLFATSFGEALNETDGAVYKGTDIVERIGKGLIIGGRHRVVLAASAPAIETARIEQQAAYRPPQAVFSASNMVNKDAQTVSSFAQAALPPNVELQTLQLLFDGSILLRLAHSFAVNESKQYSVPVKVDLNDLFTQPIQSATQTTLTANAKFKARSELDLQSVLDDTVVTINPMQILTFVLTF